MSTDVVGLGVSTVDFLLIVDELPSAEAVQRAYESSLQGGGPAATALVTLARLGASTAMIDCLGDDWLGQLIVGEFRRECVSTSGIHVVAGHSSSIASILVRKRDGARAIAYLPGDSGGLPPEKVPEDIVKGAKILHVNGRHWDACLHAVRLARRYGVLVSFDGGAHRFQPRLRELVPLTDICIVAQDFARVFTDKSDPEAAARTLLDAGPRLVVVTAGMAGSWVYTLEREEFHQPAFALEKVVDTTGAGDAYHGAFLFGLISGYSLRRTARLASAVAALNTRALGGRVGLPSLAEARDFLRSRGLADDAA